jgi:hypothetical protein
MSGFGDELLIIRGPSGVVDQSDYGNDGSFNGAVNVVPDVSAGGVSAFSMSSDTGDHITLPVIPLTQTDFTLACWVNISHWDAGLADGLLGTWGDNNNARRYLLNRGANRLLQFFVGASESPVTFDVSGLSGWHLVAGAFNNTSKVATLWLDGQSVASNVISVTLSGTTQPAKIGRQNENNDQGLDGRIDDIRIRPKLTTQNEFLSWFFVGRGYNVKIASFRRRRMMMQRGGL